MALVDTLQAILVGLLSLWFFGWCGTVFLSSTRVVFATAFDRVLPEAVAKTSRNGVPYIALLLMFIPSILISYFYAFGEDFATWTLNATLVIAVTFCINNPASFRYLAVMYALALVMYVGFRLLRRAQGMDLKMVYSEIPED